MFGHLHKTPWGEQLTETLGVAMQQLLILGARQQGIAWWHSWTCIQSRLADFPHLHKRFLPGQIHYAAEASSHCASLLFCVFSIEHHMSGVMPTQKPEQQHACLFVSCVALQKLSLLVPLL